MPPPNAHHKPPTKGKSAPSEPRFPWEDQPDDEPRLLAFFVLLPDAIGIVDEESTEPLAIPDGLWFTFLEGEETPTATDIGPLTSRKPLPDDLTGLEFVALGFRQIRAPSYAWTAYREAIKGVLASVVPPGLAHPMVGATGDQAPRTVVVAITPMSPDQQAQGPAGVRSGFERCIHTLADFVSAWRVSHYVSIPPLTPERLNPGVPFATRGLGRKWGWDKRLGMLVIHGNLPDQPTPPYDLGTGPAGLRHALYLIRSGYPLITYRERLTDAQVALIRRGEYSVAVILAQAAAEVYLDGVLSLLLWEEAKSPDEAAQSIFVEGLAKRLRTQFHPRLGGSWSPTSGSSIGSLYQYLFPLRGRVVHGGYDPSFAEAKSAVDILHAVEEFVLQRLIAKRTAYPSTALQVVGEIGLQDRGHWSGKIRKWAASHDAGDEMATFMAWRNQLEDARASLIRA